MTGLLQLSFSMLVFATITNANVGSLQVELRDYLSETETRHLRNVTIYRPRQLLRALRDPDASHRIQHRLQWSDQRAKEVLDQTRLFTFKGIGVSDGGLLRDVGVVRPENLCGWEPLALHARLSAAAQLRGVTAPRLDMVRVWILASRDGGIVMRAD